MLCASNWRDGDAYTYLDKLGSTAFAWEFLRRNSAYRAAYQSIAGNSNAAPQISEWSAQRWGLRFAVDPDLRADHAPVVWLPHLNPSTVVVAPAPKAFTDVNRISELRPAFSRRSANGEHWLLEQGGDALPVALIDGADTARQAAVVIPFDGSFPTRIEAALRLWEAVTGRTPRRRPNGLTAQQRSRLKAILRALDGKLAGCSYRAIAEVLFGRSSIPAGRAWNTHDLRSRTIRYCRRGLDLMHGGYLDLMLYPRRFHG